MIIQVFSAFWAVAMFSILTETPKKFLPYAAFSGGFAWWAYLVINNLTHSTLQAAYGRNFFGVSVRMENIATAQNALNTCMIIRVLLPCCGLQEVPHQLQTQLQVPQRSLPEFWRIRLRSPRLRYHESPL